MPPAPEKSDVKSNAPTPKVDERFVVKPRFGPKVVRMLNADGHIDVAHKMGLIGLRSHIVDRWHEDVQQTNDEGENFISRTHWCIVKVTAQVKTPDGLGVITVDGLSMVSDRDQFVKKPGYEVAVAETRATKRALANACNITEKYISPEATEATRETVDMPLPKDEEFNEKPHLPQEVIRKPDISPPIDGIKQREVPAGGQFDI